MVFQLKYIIYCTFFSDCRLTLWMFSKQLLSRNWNSALKCTLTCGWGMWFILCEQRRLDTHHTIRWECNYSAPFCTSGYPALRVTIDYGVARSQLIVCAMSEKRPSGSPTFLTPTQPLTRAWGRPTYNRFPPALCTRANVYVHVRIEGHMTYDACPTSSTVWVCQHWPFPLLH